MGRSTVIWKNSGICREPFLNRLKARDRAELIASAIVTGVGKRRRELRHQRQSAARNRIAIGIHGIAIVGRRSGELSLMRVADLSTKFQCRSVIAQMVENPHRCIALQIDLRRLPTSEIDVFQFILGWVIERRTGR